MRNTAGRLSLYLLTASLLVYQGTLLAERPHYVNIVLFGLSCIFSGALWK